MKKRSHILLYEALKQAKQHTLEHMGVNKA